MNKPPKASPFLLLLLTISATQQNTVTGDSVPREDFSLQINTPASAATLCRLEIKRRSGDSRIVGHCSAFTGRYCRVSRCTKDRMSAEKPGDAQTIALRVTGVPESEARYVQREGAPTGETQRLVAKLPGDRKSQPLSFSLPPPTLLPTSPAPHFCRLPGLLLILRRTNWKSSDRDCGTPFSV